MRKPCGRWEPTRVAENGRDQHDELKRQSRGVPRQNLHTDGGQWTGSAAGKNYSRTNCSPKTVAGSCSVLWLRRWIVTSEPNNFLVKVRKGLFSSVGAVELHERGVNALAEVLNAAKKGKVQ